MDTINLFFGILLLSYSLELNGLKHQKLDKQVQVSLFSFVALLFVGAFLIYANINTRDPSGNLGIVFVVIAFVCCFFISIVAIKRFLLLLEKSKFESKLLKSPQEVLAFLASKNIYIGDSPIFLVSFKEVLFWHIGKNLLSADFLVSIDCLFYNPTIEYTFVKNEQVKFYYQLGFLGKTFVLLENKSFREFEKIKKNYEFIKEEVR